MMDVLWIVIIYVAVCAFSYWMEQRYIRQEEIRKGVLRQ